MFITKIKFAILLCFVVFTKTYAQVGIGTKNSDISSILDIKSTTQGLLPPYVILAQDLDDHDEGLVVYDLTDDCLKIFNSNNWINLCEAVLRDQVYLNYVISISAARLDVAEVLHEKSYVGILDKNSTWFFFGDRAISFIGSFQTTGARDANNDGDTDQSSPIALQLLSGSVDFRTLRN